MTTTVKGIRNSKFTSRKSMLAMAVAAAIGAAFTPASTHAAVIGWNNTGTTWATGTNWTGSTAPANNITQDIAQFDLGSYTNQPNAGTTSVNGIQIGDGTTATGALTISLTTLTLGSSGINMFAHAGAATLSGGTVTLAAAQTWTNNSSNALAVNSALVHNIGATIDFNNTGSGSFTTSTITNTSGIIGPWATFGTGASMAYATVSGGTIVGLSSTAVGAASVTDTTGTVNYDVNAVGSLAGTSFNTIRYVSGSAAGSMTGAFTANGLMNDGGALTFSGAVTIGSTKELVVTGPGNFTFSAAVGNSGANASALTYSGTGTLTLGAANTYTGNTFVNSGTLQIGASGGIYTSTSTQTITVASGATLMISNANNNPLGHGSSQTWNVAGTLTEATNGVQIIPGIVNLNGGTLTSTAGNTTFGSFVVFDASDTINANGTGNTISSVDFGIANGLFLTLNTPLATDALSATTIFKNANGGTTGGITKTGLGTVTFSGVNTYTGGTTISAGTLKISGSGSLGSGNYSGNISNSGTLLYASSANQTLAGVISGGGALTANTFASGAFTVVSPAARTDGPYTIGNAITLANSLTLIKFGVYAGVGAVGTLGLQAEAGLWNSSNTKVIDVIVPAGTPISSDGYAYVYITPQTLAAGNYSIGGLTTNHFFDNAGAAFIPVSGLGITVTSAIFNGSSSFAQPTTAGGGNAERWGAADFNVASQVILSGSNTYTGPTTVANGVLQAGVNTIAFGNNSAVTVATGAYLDLNGHSETIGSLAGDTSSTGGFVYSSATGTITLTTGGNNTNTTYAGLIQNGNATVNLTKTGTGTQTLTGANTFTGLTTINNGVLSVNAVASGSTPQPLGENASLTLAGGTLKYTGSANGTLDKAITVSSSTLDTISNTGGGTLILTGGINKNGGTLTLAGGIINITTNGITGSSAGSDLFVDGGTVTLGVSNSYNGPTTIRDAGIINANVANALPTVNGRSPITLDDIGTGSSTLSLGVNQAIASLAGNSSTSNVNLNANTLTIGAASGSTTYAGGISGTNGGLIKDSVSTLVLAGNNSYTGGTTISAGVLQFGDGTTGHDGSLVATGGINNTAALVFDTFNTQSYAGAISGSGGTLTKIGAGKLTLSGSSSYTGATTISAGTLNLTSSLNNTSSVTLGSGATLMGTGNNSNAGIVGSAVSNSAGGGFINLTTAGSTLTLNGLTLGSTGSYGAGQYTTLTYTVGNGLLDIGTAGSSTGLLTVNSGGGFVTISGSPAPGTYTLANFGSSSTGLSNFSLSSTTAGITTLPSGFNTLTLVENSTNLQLQVIGTAIPVAYFKGGVSTVWNDASQATLTLSNWSSSVTGSPDAGNTPGSLTDVVLNANTQTGVVSTTLGADTTINSLTVNSNGTNTIAAGNVLTINAAASASGGLGYSAGTGIKVLSGANAFTISAPLVLGNTQTWTNASANLFTVGSTVSGTAAGTQTLTLAGTSTGGTTLSGAIGNGGGGGTLALIVNNTGSGITTLAGTNTYTGGTTLTSGSITLGNAGGLSAGTVTVNGGRLDLASFSPTITTLNGSGGTITNSGANGTLTVNAGSFGGIVADGAGTISLTKATAGTLTLTGVNTYTGGTTISAGTLILGGAGSLGSGGIYAGAISDATSLVFNSTANQTLSGNISGNGTLTKGNTGTLTISGSGSNTYSGGTTLTLSTMVLSKTGGAAAIPGNFTFNHTTQNNTLLYTTQNNQFGAGAVLAFNGSSGNSARFELDGTTQTLAGINDSTNTGFIQNSEVSPANTGTSTLVLNGSGIYSASDTFRNNSSGNNASNGILSLVKSGTGTQTLSGSGIIYTGATTVSSGTLVLQNTTAFASPIADNATLLINNTTGAIGWGSAVTVNLQGALNYSSAASTQYALLGGIVTVNAPSTITTSGVAGTSNPSSGLYLDGGLQGSGGLTVTGNTPGIGLVLRTTTSTYSGSMIVNGTASTAAGAGSGLAIGGDTTGLANANLTINGTLEMGNTGMGATSSAASGNTYKINALAGTGDMVANFASGSNTTTLSVGNNNGTGSFSGIIADGANDTLSLIKNGTGTQTLAGNNSYTGGTTVSNGLLTLGAGGFLSNTSAITIANGATLNLSGSANNQLVGSSQTGTLTINGTLAATTNFAHTLYFIAINMNNGTLTNTFGQNTSGFGAFFVGGLNSGRTITASSANTISGLGVIGITSGSVLTLNTPLSSDTIAVTGTLGQGASGTAGGLTKSGLGSVTLSGANLYSGGTTVTGGTLIVTNTTGSATGTGNVAVGNGATLLTNNTSGITGTVTIASGGTLLGSSTAGQGFISGKVNIQGGGTIAAFNLAKLTLSGGLSLANTSIATFALSGTPNGTASGNGMVNITGGAFTGGGTGGTTVNITGTPQVGTYDLFGFTTTTPNINNFVLGTTPAGFVATLVQGANQIDLTEVQPLIWTGQTSGNGGTDTAWNNTSTNWANNIPAATTYADTDPVTFQDTNTIAGGNVAVASRSVVIQAGGVSPGSVAFINNNINYTLGNASGTLGISGSGSVTKSGTSTVTLNSANTYTGGTTVTAGILQVNVDHALGGNGTATTTTVTSGGELLLSNIAYGSTQNLSLAGTGTLAGAGVLAATGTSSFAGNITLSDNSTIGAASGSNLTLSGTINQGGQGLTLAGPGTITLNGAINGVTGSTFDVNGATVNLNVGAGYAGTTTVENNGLLKLGTSGNLPFGNGTPNLVIQTGGTLDINGAISAVSAITLSSGTITDASVGSTGNLAATSVTANGSGNAINATVNPSAGIALSTLSSLTIGATGNVTTPTVNVGTNANLVVNGSVMADVNLGDGASLSGTGNITNAGNGASLGNNNTLSSTGTLAIDFVTVNGTGNQITSGTVATSVGVTIGTSASLAVNSGATLGGGGSVAVSTTGILSGAGTIHGSVDVQSGGHIAPGDSAVGTMAIDNLTLEGGSILDFEFKTGPAANDFINVTSSAGLTLTGSGIGFNLYQVGTTSPFSTFGTYHLIGYTSSFSGSLSNLSVLDQAGGDSYTFSNNTSLHDIDLTIAAGDSSHFTIPNPVNVNVLLHGNAAAVVTNDGGSIGSYNTSNASGLSIVSGGSGSLASGNTGRIVLAFAGNNVYGGTSSGSFTITNANPGLSANTENVTVNATYGTATANNTDYDYTHSSTSIPSASQLSHNLNANNDPLFLTANALTADVTAGAPYDGLSSTVTGTTNGGTFLTTTATILKGNAGVAQTVTMNWRNRSASETRPTQTVGPMAHPNEFLISDVVLVTGMGLNGDNSSLHVQTDIFALSMSYLPSDLPGNEVTVAGSGGLYLGWLSPTTNTWLNAVAGDFGGMSVSEGFQGAESFSAYFTSNGVLANDLGAWGVDTTNHTVWAVLDHNSEFGVVVPEPTSLGLLGLGALGLLGRKRRKSRA